MGFWFHSTLLIVILIVFIIYFIYRYDDIIKYNTISDYSANDLLGSIFLLISTILICISFEIYWFNYLTFVYKLRIKLKKILCDNMDIFAMMLFVSVSCIGLLLIGIFPAVSYNNYYNATDYYYDKTLYYSHISGVSIFVVFSFLVMFIDIFQIKRNINTSFFSYGRHSLILIYVLFDIIIFIIFLICHYKNDSSLNFISILL